MFHFVECREQFFSIYKAILSASCQDTVKGVDLVGNLRTSAVKSLPGDHCRPENNDICTKVLKTTASNLGPWHIVSSPQMTPQEIFFTTDI